jgi:aldehyde dehydrogenase (NAD+)
MEDISKVVEAQRKFFFENKTKEVAFRKNQLIKLKNVLKANENKLCEAIYKDMKKSGFETYATELGLVYNEIKIAIRSLDKWAKIKKVKTNLINFPGKSFIIPEPFGNCLIIGAKNYPYQLSLAPLVPAIAAGNTAIIKPSELTQNSSKALAEIINQNFKPEFIYTIEGGIETTTELLNNKFDKIFFTGSTRVGKIILEAAAKHLTPVVLELGGKSPAIVMPGADLKIAARRITLGKFLNAGQTCIAPDYLLIHKTIKEDFLKILCEEINRKYGNSAMNSEAYTSIIGHNSFVNLVGLIDKDKIYFGGKSDETELFISPTILNNVSFDDKIMENEIFGPILPVIEFSDFDEIILKIKQHSKPLSLYIFTKSKNDWEKVFQEISFGGGAINDTLMHIANPNLPFGGVGHSGIGNYHDEAGFRTFSHYKSVLKKSTLFDPGIKYPPYKTWKLKILKWLLE